MKRLLPPHSASGARSSTITFAPVSAAASAAHSAALPAPTTTTSASMQLYPALPRERGDPGFLTTNLTNLTNGSGLAAFGAASFVEFVRFVVNS